MSGFNSFFGFQGSKPVTGINQGDFAYLWELSNANKHLFDGKIDVINRSRQCIHISLFENLVYGDQSVKICISESKAIASQSEGFLVFPEIINWNREFPLIESMNDRYVNITFEDGEEVMFPLGNLYMIGGNKDKIVVTPFFEVTCLTSADANFSLDNDNDINSNIADDYIFNQVVLEKLGIGTPLFTV